ncbi:uncharacterized protein [Euphorbia lathyris]|uniref:uncharacterized protein isoform X4 n=1 Tax=Euphorbia lathyris TaxID=212925 RepID=UPI003313511D
MRPRFLYTSLGFCFNLDHGSSQSQGDSPDEQSPGSSQRSTRQRLPPLYRRMVLPDWLMQGVDATLTDPASSSGASPGPSPTSAMRASSAPITRGQSASAPAPAPANPTPPPSAPLPSVQPIQNDERHNLHQGPENNEVNVEDQETLHLGQQ